MATTVAVYLAWLINPRSRYVESGALYGYLITVIISDYSTLSRGDRLWSTSVLVMDAALVLAIPSRHTVVCLATLVTYFVLVAVDRSATGLYMHDGDEKPWVCDCTDPPCLQPWVTACKDVVMTLCVFLCDFFLTRGFADQMRHQMAVVSDSIDVTEEIAQLLSMYEVEEGRALLEGEQGAKLPARLKGALHRLLSNLDQYRPYLPDVMLLREGVELSLSTNDPPGLGHKELPVTVCFTDIQSSTALWEMYPQGMHTALQVHNDAIRETARSCGGYEVKVIGDSFMLAFAGVEDACRFSLDTQAALADQRWPSDLMQHPLCTQQFDESGAMIWNGLRVRIGLNCGPVRVEKNPVTGRCDYFGTPVNTAARVEACLGHGGLTGVTEAVLSEMGPGWGARLGNPVCKALGRKELKGVTAAVDVTVLLNASLSDRLALLSTPVPRFGQVRLSSVLEASGWSSGAGSTRYFAVEGAVPTPFRDGLSQRTATCASFRPRCTDHLPALGTAVSDMLEAVGQAADATQGVIAGSMSMQCVVVWNGPRACGDHYDQCLRASDYVRRLRGGAVAAGCCTGEVLYGSVSALRKKHATVIGGCVELSSALAEAADEGGEAALATGTFALYCGTQRRTACYAEWRVSQSCEEITVFSILPAPSDEEMWLESPRMRQESEQRFHSPDSFCAAESASERRCRVVLVGAGVQMA
eukprot:TRINITY_DN1325_c0_g1_i2.p1 TRINITY_DN1325_c0_g1~~TRINITY_DN1325_c0_g1_i2.p1  ORF type:complete len:791 (+),score=207.58 TRINITY_DN1325_c0_g1_i2:278-2374(+)